jgi:hypothetical protein
LYSQGLSSWALPARIGVTPDDNDVLTCRQIATVISALGKASHIMAINGHDKAEIAPEVCDTVNEQMTGIRRYWRVRLVGCAPGEDQPGTGQTDDVND